MALTERPGSGTCARQPCWYAVVGAERSQRPSAGVSSEHSIRCVTATLPQRPCGSTSTPRRAAHALVLLGVWWVGQPNKPRAHRLYARRYAPWSATDQLPPLPLGLRGVRQPRPPHGAVRVARQAELCELRLLPASWGPVAAACQTPYHVVSLFCFPPGHSKGVPAPANTSSSAYCLTTATA